MTTLLNYDSEQISPDTKLSPHPAYPNPSRFNHTHPLLVGPQSGQSVFFFCESLQVRPVAVCICSVSVSSSVSLSLTVCDSTHSLRMRRVAPAARDWACDWACDWAWAWAWTSPSSVHMFRDPLPGILITSLIGDLLLLLLPLPAALLTYDHDDKCTLITQCSIAGQTLPRTESESERERSYQQKGLSFRLTLIFNNIIIYRYSTLSLALSLSVSRTRSGITRLEHSHFRHVLENRSQFRSSDITRTPLSTLCRHEHATFHVPRSTR